jgi:preprotein translocase subunit SecA
LRSEGIPHEILNAKNHEREGEISPRRVKRVVSPLLPTWQAAASTSNSAGALASQEEHEEVKALGGLYVIGTERHEARRIDNQLRGRSGRQGDPGETRFFVSLEDNLMRVFASDMIKNMMGRFGIPEDEPIENKWYRVRLRVHKQKSKGFNFDARKHVLEFDNVLDKQRRAIYDKRRRVLVGSQDDVANVLDELSQGKRRGSKLA